MKKTIYVCDRCGKEVNWLYEIPTFRIDGLAFNVLNDCKYEICKECLSYLCDYIDRFGRSTKIK